MRLRPPPLPMWRLPGKAADYSRSALARQHYLGHIQQAATDITDPAWAISLTWPIAQARRGKRRWTLPVGRSFPQALEDT